MREERYKRLICELLHQFYPLGWVSGTGGGMAIKNPLTKNIIMSPSSVQKERLKPHNLFVLDEHGKIIEYGNIHKFDVIGELKDELKLTACYTLFMSCLNNKLHPETGCVIHSHSQNVSLVSLMFNDFVEISGLEMIKGITGHSNLEKCIVPIIQNTPKEPQLTKRLQNALKKYPKSYAVIVRGHGMYCFGKNWQKAKQHTECYDYLFEMIIKMKQLNVGSNMLYNTKYFNSFPVKTNENENDDEQDDVVIDTIDYKQHREY